MDSANAPAGEPPVFHATLTPHRSLTRRGRLVVIGVVGAVNLAAAGLFAASGAWPILPFLGLDVALVWAAFAVNDRAARVREEVLVTASHMTVRRVAPDGGTSERQFNPRWVRLTKETHGEAGITRLALVERGRAFEVGGFLPPADKASFHDALAAALATARRGHALGAVA